MAQQVKIPAFGESINSASIGRWHKADGEAVQKGEVLATLDTDKVSSELEAEVGGTLRILVPEGEEVEIGAVIGEITEGAAAPAAPVAPAPPPAAPADQPPEAPPSGAEESPGREIKVKVPPFGESITSSNVAQWHKRDGESVAKGEILVTLETDKVSSELQAEEGGLLSIQVAEGSEVEIGTVIGTILVGEGGAASAPASPAASGERPTAVAPSRVSSGGASLKPDLAVVSAPPVREEASVEVDGRTTRKRMSTLRRKIATQLVAAQHQAAILTTFNEADMSAVMRLRKSVQDEFVAKHGLKLGFMSFFVKAVVQGLKEVPSVNGRIDGNDLVQNHFYDIGIAVGTEKGLIVPVVRDADQKGFAEIEQDILDYAVRARDGKIQLEDLQGGCFTISNGGVYGSLLSTPILNPPQSGILGMHTIQQRPVAVDGAVVIRPMMYLALSYDHRIVDGKEAVTFLIKVKDSIENPTRLMLEI